MGFLICGSGDYKQKAVGKTRGKDGRQKTDDGGLQRPDDGQRGKAEDGGRSKRDDRGLMTDDGKNKYV